MCVFVKLINYNYALEFSFSIVISAKKKKNNLIVDL